MCCCAAGLRENGTAESGVPRASAGSPHPVPHLSSSGRTGRTWTWPCTSCRVQTSSPTPAATVRTGRTTRLWPPSGCPWRPGTPSRRPRHLCTCPRQISSPPSSAATWAHTCRAVTSCPAAPASLQSMSLGALWSLCPSSGTATSSTRPPPCRSRV